MYLRVFLTAALIGSTCLASARAGEQAAPGTSEAVTGTPTPVAVESDDTIARYQATLHQYETDFGVYDRRVGEQLLGLGMAYATQGRHREAVTALRRSLNIMRINDGLNTPAQLPILEAIISQNEALRDWNALDRNYDYLYWVERRNYGDGDVRLLPVMERLGHWKLKAFEEGAGNSPEGYLQQASRIFTDAAEIAEKNYGPDSPMLIAPLYGVATANYELSSFYAIQDLQARNQMRLSMNSYYDETADRAYEAEQERQMAVLISYGKGAGAMRRVLDLYKKNPDISNEAHAHALLHAGDWYLLENRPGDALAAYGEAYAVMQKGGASAEQLRQIFGAPHALSPDLMLRPPPLEISPQVPKGTEPHSAVPAVHKSWVVTVIDVSKHGRPFNVRVQKSVPAGNETLKRRAREYVHTIIFRPRIDNGEAVATSNYQFRVIFDE